MTSAWSRTRRWSRERLEQGTTHPGLSHAGCRPRAKNQGKNIGIRYEVVSGVEKRMTVLSESADDPFALHSAASAVLDDRGTVVGWSRRAQELLGYPESAVIGRSAFDVLIDPGDRPAAEDAAATGRRDGGWFGVL